MENEAATTADKKRTRTLSILLGTSVFICLLFLTYAFIQKEEANRQRHLAEFLQIQVDLQRKEASSVQNDGRTGAGTVHAGPSRRFA